MTIVALIPARGGSKSIPRKNIQPLMGRPLMAYSIEQAQRVTAIDRVVVSTDDPEIADVARCYEVEVISRPPALAQDLTPDLPVFQHAMYALELQPEDLLVHLRPTSPLRSPGLIEQCLAALTDEATAVRTVCPPEHTPFKMFYDESPYLRPLFEQVGDLREPYNQPRQLLPRVIEPNGCVDVIRVSTLIRYGAMMGPRIIPVHMPRDSTVDIDTWADLARAEKIMRQASQ